MVTILAVYYNTLLAWVLYYFFASFTINELSWKKCGMWLSNDFIMNQFDVSD